MQNKGRIFTMLQNKMPLKREDFMKFIEIKDSEMLRRFLKELEDNNIIKRFHKQNKLNIYFLFTDEFLKFLNIPLNLNQYNYNFIYRLYKNDTIVYVGKTNNIFSRINNHKKDKDFDTYDYAILSDSEAHFYETYYINKHKPILNKDCKGISEFNIKLKELEFMS